MTAVPSAPTVPVVASWWEAGGIVPRGARHDAPDHRAHRTAAATVVLFPERLRLGSDLPVLAEVVR